MPPRKASAANRSATHLQHVPDGPAFAMLCFVLLWAPLPLGSNRYWSMGILCGLAGVLFLMTLYGWRNHAERAGGRLALFATPLAILGAIVAWTWLQCVPLPHGLLAWLSPHTADIYQGHDFAPLSVDLYATQMAGSLASTYWLVFACALLLVRSQERLKTLALVLVVGGLVQAVIGAVLYSIKADYQIFFTWVTHDRTRGTFVYHNALAGYLCLSLSVGIGLMLGQLGASKPIPQARNWRGWVTRAARFALSPTMRLRMYLVIIVIALVLTRSRMGNTAFFASMLIVGGLSVLIARKNAPHTIALIVSLIIIDIVVVGTGVGLEKVVERIEGTELMNADRGAQESVEARTAGARMSLPIIKDFPVFGTGGGTFYVTFMTYREPTYGYAYLDHTHNDFVELACDYGLVGLGLFAALVASTLWVSIRTLATRSSRLPWGAAFGSAMAITALLLHSTVDFNLQIPSNALTIVVILAMAWIARDLPSSKAQ